MTVQLVLKFQNESTALQGSHFQWEMGVFQRRPFLSLKLLLNPEGLGPEAEDY